MLKGERVVLETDISLTCESVAERGVVLCHKTSGSGIALGDSAGKADLYTSASGQKVAGLLLEDVVSVDQTRYHLNFHKDEIPVGNRACLLRKGTVTTNKVTGSTSAGQTAYLTSNGVLTATLSASGGLVATPKVGEFKGSVDESGFVKVDINLPM